ncbi:ATP-binding protein [Gallionella capsiferriformans]|uniref:ATP-binding region ATPase domain protein n=1 Tax=Gallionella capsiferriformans (strain ES-2) TaxID=395494 RepID=D9SD35_GALCS|nr:ATP-binding protein [Gallionella capsiferriformans]ADL54724.1 ATP-binding region ATPase domain protein [Gallionella capsiferriformans ES-2]
MSFPIIPQNLSIAAMRSSGYRDTAHALAELIDNAIQAGEETKTRTEVEVICIDEVSTEGRRQTSRIAVYDNAIGMSPGLLRKSLQFGNGSRLDRAQQKGIGKFGMGLPNSSISQCKRVDVWTWQDGVVHHAYLDVQDIQDGKMIEVPESQPSEIPSEWRSLIAGNLEEHGTLVVWSKLDRITWKQSTTLLRHTEFISGRVYRHFINDKSVRIRLAAYESKTKATVYESFVRPNDPLYLMSGTNAPAPFNQMPAFVPFGQPLVLKVALSGVEHSVTIMASICKPEARREGGGKAIGQHAQRNQGISVVRSRRELELNHSFTNSYDTRERWWGIEVQFEPGLDDVFGVSNNKQSATGFTYLSVEEDSFEEGLSAKEYQERLEQDRDPQLVMYRISREIEKLLHSMRAQVAKMREGERIDSAKERAENKAEKAATDSVMRRRERVGDIGRSDKEEHAHASERASALTADIVQDGVEEAKAQVLAVEYVSKKIKFRFRHAEISGFNIFDISTAGGVILVTLNTRHPVHARIFEVLRGEEGPETQYARQVLSLVAAWARMEDEAASGQLRRAMEENRSEWGRMAMDFFEIEN